MKEDYEDLERALQPLRATEERSTAPQKKELQTVPRPTVSRRPEVLNDFIRNVPLKMGMTDTLDKFQKERDFHEMHHKRVVQEKNKLIVDLKRLKDHNDNYEPMLATIRSKYETAMKEEMLMKLSATAYQTGLLRLRLS